MANPSTISNKITIKNNTTGKITKIKQNLTMSNTNPDLISFTGKVKQEGPDNKFAEQKIFHIEENKGNYSLVFDSPAAITSPDQKTNLLNILGSQTRFPLQGDSAINIAKSGNGEICFQVNVDGKTQILKIVANATTINVDLTDEKGEVLNSFAFKQPLLATENQGIQIDMKPEFVDKCLDKNQPLFKTYVTEGKEKETLLLDAPHSIRQFPIELVELRAMNLPEKVGQFNAGDFTVTYFKPEKTEAKTRPVPCVLVTQPERVNKDGKVIQPSTTYLLQGGHLIKLNYTMLQYEKQSKNGYISLNGKRGKEIVNYEVAIGDVENLNDPNSNALDFIKLLDDEPLVTSLAQKPEDNKDLSSENFGGYKFNGYDALDIQNLSKSNRGRSITIEEGDGIVRDDVDYWPPEDNKDNTNVGIVQNNLNIENTINQQIINQQLNLNQEILKNQEEILTILRNYEAIINKQDKETGNTYHIVNNYYNTYTNTDIDKPDDLDGDHIIIGDPPGHTDDDHTEHTDDDDHTGDTDSGPDPGPGPEPGPQPDPQPEPEPIIEQDENNEDENQTEQGEDQVNVPGLDSNDTQTPAIEPHRKKKGEWQKGATRNFNKHVEGYGEALSYIGVFLALVSVLVPFGPILLIAAGVIAGLGVAAMTYADKFNFAPYYRAIEKTKKLKEIEDEDQEFAENFMANENTLDKLESKATEKENNLTNMLVKEDGKAKNPELDAFAELYNEYGVGFENIPPDQGKKIDQLFSPAGHQIRQQMMNQLQEINNAAAESQRIQLINQFMQNNFVSMPQEKQDEFKEQFFGQNTTKENIDAKKEKISTFISALDEADYAEKEYFDLLKTQQDNLGRAKDSNIEKYIKTYCAGNDKNLDKFTDRYSHVLVRRYANDDNLNEQKINKILDNLSLEQQAKFLDALNHAHQDIVNGRESVEKLAKENREKVALAKDIANYGKVMNELDNNEAITSFQDVGKQAIALITAITAKNQTDFRKDLDNQAEQIRQDIRDIRNYDSIKRLLTTTQNLVDRKPPEINLIRNAQKEITKNLSANFGLDIADMYVNGIKDPTLPSTNTINTPTQTIETVAQGIVDKELLKIDANYNNLTKEEQNKVVEKLSPNVRSLKTNLDAIKDSRDLLRDEQKTNLNRDIVNAKTQIDMFVRDLQRDKDFMQNNNDFANTLTDAALKKDVDNQIETLKKSKYTSATFNQNEIESMAKQMVVLRKLINNKYITEDMKKVLNYRLNVLNSMANGTFLQNEVDYALASGAKESVAIDKDFDFKHAQRNLASSVKKCRHAVEIIDSFTTLKPEETKELKEQFRSDGKLRQHLTDKLKDAQIEENDLTAEQILTKAAPDLAGVKNILFLSTDLLDQQVTNINQQLAKLEQPLNQHYSQEQIKLVVTAAFKTLSTDKAQQDNLIKKYQSVIDKTAQYLASSVDPAKLQNIIQEKIDIQNNREKNEIHCHDQALGEEYVEKLDKHCRKTYNKDNTPTYENEFDLLLHLARDEKYNKEDEVLEAIQNDPKLSAQKLAASILKIEKADWEKEKSKVRFASKGLNETAQKDVTLKQQEIDELLVMTEVLKYNIEDLLAGKLDTNSKEYFDEALSMYENGHLKPNDHSEAYATAQFLAKIGIGEKQLDTISKILAGDDAEKVVEQLKVVIPQLQPLQKADDLLTTKLNEKANLQMLTKVDSKILNNQTKFDEVSSDKENLADKIECLTDLKKQGIINEQELKKFMKAFAEGTCDTQQVTIDGENFSLNDILYTNYGKTFSQNDVELLKRLKLTAEDLQDEHKRTKKVSKIINNLTAQEKSLNNKLKNADKKANDNQKGNDKFDKKSENDITDGLGLFGQLFTKLLEIKNQEIKTKENQAIREQQEELEIQAKIAQQAAQGTENEDQTETEDEKN